MAINAYTGLMGSGKSYEVVENIILPALASGRRVVTNVADLQIDDINAYLQESQAVAPEKLGQIVQVQNDDLEKDNFFPVELLPGQTPVISVVKPGDLVVVDECWRWWSSGSKIMPAHMVFFRMHRHFVNQETKATCDLVLVVQDISDLDRKLKVVVENTYRMSKHKSLGMTTRYRVDIYASYRTTRAPYRSLQRKYNPDIFKLYQSYSQAGGKSGNEVPIDDRSNIFKGALFRVFLPLLFLVFGGCIWMLWRFFNPAPVQPSSKNPTNATAKNPKSASSAPASLQNNAVGESDWRVVGHYAFDSNQYVTIARGQSIRTLMNPKGFYFDALRATGTLDGNLLTNYTGQTESSSLISEPKK